MTTKKLQDLLDNSELSYGRNTIDGINIFYSDREHLKVGKVIYFIYNKKIVATHVILYEAD